MQEALLDVSSLNRLMIPPQINNLIVDFHRPHLLLDQIRRRLVLQSRQSCNYVLVQTLTDTLHAIRVDVESFLLKNRLFKPSNYPLLSLLAILALPFTPT
jgi:hypothetical protein